MAAAFSWVGPGRPAGVAPGGFPGPPAGPACGRVGRQRGDMNWSFSDGLPPNRTCPFSGHLGSPCLSWMPWGASAVDALVACAADDEGLAVACRHQPGPFRRVVPSLAVEVFECPDVVHLDLFPRSAQLALVGQEPLGDLGAVAPDAGGVVVEVGRTGGRAPSAPAQTAGRSEFLGLGSCMSTISTVLGGPDASASPTRRSSSIPVCAAGITA